MEEYQNSIANLNLVVNKKAKNNINKKSIKLESLYYLADNYIALENYPAAIENCDRALEIDSKYAHCHWMRANAYLCSNDYQNALIDCDRALELDDKLVETYAIKGFAYYHSEEFEKAIAISQKHQYKMLEEKAIALLNQLSS